MRHPIHNSFRRGMGRAFTALAVVVVAVVAPSMLPSARGGEVVLDRAPYAWSRPAPASSGGEGQDRQWLRRAFMEKPRVKPVANPDWQKLYKLGPGDILNFSFYQRPELVRQNVIVAPDGKVSYLQAVGVGAAGKTIGQLREAVEKELSAYHQGPRVMITPFKLGSRKFTIMGKVRQPGVYPLQYPTTILEALAISQGLEIGAIEGAAFEIADMNQSFVVRDGRKLDVDLGRLYYEGDLTQNAFLEPGDYVYVASSFDNECYVIGAVTEPKRVRLVDRVTVTRAIAQSGGFSTSAWREKVLVIRGSINQPEIHVLSLNDILNGRAADMLLENRDIVYIHNRPWYRLEKILDTALISFAQAAVTGPIDDYYDQESNDTDDDSFSPSLSVEAAPRTPAAP